MPPVARDGRLNAPSISYNGQQIERAYRDKINSNKKITESGGFHSMSLKLGEM